MFLLLAMWVRHHAVRAIDELIEDRVELIRNAILKISAMHRVLLHLPIYVSLENVAEETIMSLFKALKIVLEDFIFHFEYLDLAQG